MTSLRKRKTAVSRTLLERGTLSALEDHLWGQMRPIGAEFGSPDFDRLMDENCLNEILAKAAEVFGGKVAAQRWLSLPAVGLNGSGPIDLLQTSEGAGVVGDYLGRLKRGVFS